MVSKRALLLITLLFTLAGCLRPANDSFEGVNSESADGQTAIAQVDATQPTPTNTRSVPADERSATVIVIQPETEVPPSTTPTEALPDELDATATDTLLPFESLSTNTPTPEGDAEPTTTPSPTPSPTPSNTPPPTVTQVILVTPEPPSVLQFDTPTPSLTSLPGDGTGTTGTGDAGDGEPDDPNAATGGNPFPANCLYTIESGDTLFGLASRYAEFTFNELLNANSSINEDSILQIGQELNLPNCENGRYIGDQEIVVDAATPTNAAADTPEADDSDADTDGGADATATDAGDTGVPAAATAEPTRTPAPRLSVTPVPTTTPLAAGECLYVVRRGDTLSALATRFGVFIRDIAEANNIANANFISEGDQLIIPNQDECP
jgi:LysM repeat protein